MPIVFDEDKVEALQRAWTGMVLGLSEWAERVSKGFTKLARTWFPLFRQLHRDEVKRVHTAYRRKQKARRKRKRKR